MTPALKSNLLTIAAGLAGLSVPALITGRAVLGILLGLAFVIALIGCSWPDLKARAPGYFRSPLAYLIYACVLGTGVNVFFSLRPDLSWEAWARTYAVLGASLVLILAVRDKLTVLLGTLTLASSAFLGLTSIGIFEPSKPFLNGLVLVIPVFFLWASYQSRPLYFAIPLLNTLLILYNSVHSGAKAAILGVGLIALTAAFLYGIKRLRLRVMISALGVLMLPIIYLIGWWVPAQMGYSGEIRSDLLPLPGSLIDAHRQMIWMFSLDLFSQSPWVGFGLNASNYHPTATLSVETFFGPAYSNLNILSQAQVLPGHPHSWVIELLVDSGLFGFIPFTLCVLATFFLSFRLYLRTNDFPSLALCCIQVGFWATGLINFSFWSVWWQVIYILCSLSVLIYGEVRRANGHAQ